MKRRNIITIISTLLLSVSGTGSVFADDTELTEYMAGNLEFYVPSDWIYEYTEGEDQSESCFVFADSENDFGVVSVIVQPMNLEGVTDALLPMYSSFFDTAMAASFGSEISFQEDRAATIHADLHASYTEYDVTDYVDMGVPAYAANYTVYSQDYIYIISFIATETVCDENYPDYYGLINSLHYAEDNYTPESSLVGKWIGRYSMVDDELVDLSSANLYLIFNYDGTFTIYVDEEERTSGTWKPNNLEGFEEYAYSYTLSNMNGVDAAYACSGGSLDDSNIGEGREIYVYMTDSEYMFIEEKCNVRMKMRSDITKDEISEFNEVYDLVTNKHSWKYFDSNKLIPKPESCFLSGVEPFESDGVEGYITTNGNGINIIRSYAAILDEECGLTTELLSQEDNQRIYMIKNGNTSIASFGYTSIGDGNYYFVIYLDN